MQRATRNPTSARTATLLALSVTLCAGSSAVAATPGERRTNAEADDAVAALMACLNAAARTLAGQTAVIVARPASPLRLAAARTVRIDPTPRPRILRLPQAPHVSLLNLPPPAMPA